MFIILTPIFLYLQNASAKLLTVKSLNSVGFRTAIV